MTSRAMIFLGLTVAVAACSKNAQETDALSPAPRDSVQTSQRSDEMQKNKKASDTTVARMDRPDTAQYGKDSTRMRTDSTGQR